MAKKRKQETITIECRYGKWILSRRGGADGMIQADGRSNPISFGRHSLGVRDMQEAKRIVHELDLRMAVNNGLAEPRLLHNQAGVGLTIERGVAVFEKHISRPRAARGPKKTTGKRYGRILRAFKRYCDQKKIRYFENINADVLNDYAHWRRETCTESTVATELRLFRQLHSHLIDERYLDQSFAFRYQIRQPKESSRYCPTPQEMKAILERAYASEDNQWLGDAAFIMSHAGLRLAEAAALTSHDIEFVNETGEGFIHVRDESFRGEDAKSTKNGYSRVIPIHPSISQLLRQLKSQRAGSNLLVGPRCGKLRSDTFADHLREVSLVPLANQFSHPGFQSITAHCLRHFFSSLGAASNISQQTVMDWMGQRTDSMAKRYFHRNDEASLRNIKKIEPILDVPPERTGGTLSTPDEPEADDPNADDTVQE